MADGLEGAGRMASCLHQDSRRPDADMTSLLGQCIQSADDSWEEL